MELKRCPFCGCQEIDTEIIEDDKYAVCQRCSSESWLSNWQNRPIEDALRDELEEVTAERNEYERAS